MTVHPLPGPPQRSLPQIEVQLPRRPGGARGPGWLRSRLAGPGGLYNLGNALGLVGGLALHVAASSGARFRLDGGLAAAWDYLAGSGGAAAITLAMVIFFWSGERYHRAWANGFPPDARLTRLGDVSSGVGALVLGLGLLLTGQPLLAATAGLLHAIGKFGSALPGTAKMQGPVGPKAFRALVIASRVPAILLVVLKLGALLALPEASANALAGCGLLLACYLIWTRADLLLFRAD